MKQPVDSSPPERKWALIVGVNCASQAQDLVLQQPLHAVEDAWAIANALETYGNFRIWQGEPLLNEKADTRSVQEAITRLELQSTDKDFLLFYFSGHGSPLLSEDELGQSSETYLVTWDFSEDLAREGLHLSHRWIRDHFYRSRRAGKILIVLDSCYAGDLGRVGSSFSEQVKEALETYFGEPDKNSMSYPKGLRQALLATAHARPTHELDGHGIMTKYLIEALEGRVDRSININNGDVTLHGIIPYLEESMREGELSSLTGMSGGQTAVLAVHKQRASELRARSLPMQQKPLNRIPFQRDPVLQFRAEELEGEGGLMHLLEHHSRLGLVGRRGMGKTWLARELAFRCEDDNRYPGGIFWMQAGQNDYASWVHELAELAKRTNYLPLNQPSIDDGAQLSDHEEHRARHFCRYIARARDALLIIQGLENSHLITRFLPDLASGSLNCKIVYTSTQTILPEAYHYEVKPFTPLKAMSLLLQDMRPAVLANFRDGKLKDREVQAAMDICQQVGYLAHSLKELRTRLWKDPQLSLTQLHTLLKEQGLGSSIDGLEGLRQLNWEDVKEEKHQQFFLLASLFPVTTPIPLWLLELAAGFEQPGVETQARRQVCGLLVNANWIEMEQEQASVEKRIFLYQAQKEFGEALLQADPQRAETLKRQAAQHLLHEFTHGDRLQQLCKGQNMYWQCLDKLRQARYYAQMLDEKTARTIEDIERCLDRGSSLLVHEKWWIENLPALFYQHLHNWFVEENTTIAGQRPERWLRLEQPIGAEDRALLRTLGGHKKGITSVAFSPDGQEILTGSNDGSAYLWESASGRLRLPLTGHKGGVTCIAFSPDNTLVITGSHDKLVRVWERQSGTLKYTLEGHIASITCLVCSGDGRLFTGSNDCTVRVWNLVDGTFVNLWRLPKSVHALALAQDRKWAVVASNDTLRVWEYATRRAFSLWHRQDAPITCMAISPDERFVAFSEMKNSSVVHLLDCEQRLVLHRCVGHTQPVRSIAFLPGQNHWLLTGAKDATARLWDYTTGHCLATLTGHIGPITGVACSPDQRFLLTASLERTAHLWDRVIAQQIYGDLVFRDGCTDDTKSDRSWEQPFSSPSSRRALIAPDGKYALVVCGSNAQLWRTEKRACIIQFGLAGTEELAFSRLEETLFVRKNGEIEVRNCIDGELRTPQQDAEQAQRSWDKQVAETLVMPEPPMQEMLEIPVPGNRRYHIVGFDNGYLSVVDTQGSDLSKETSEPGKRLEDVPVTHLNFSPTNELLVAVNQRGRLFILDWNGRTIGALLGLYQALGPVAALRWLANDRLLLVDISLSGLPPHFHLLHLEGAWTQGGDA